MIRILGYLIAVAALVGGAVWLADHPGQVAVNWLSWRVDTSVPVMIVAVLLFWLVVTAVFRFLAGFFGLPGRLSRRSREKRQIKGNAALTGAITAIAAGDVEAAKRLAKDTDKTLKNPQLSHLLNAEIDRAKGDIESARTHYDALLETPETELAGLRGLIETLPPDDPRLDELAARAYERAPGAAWAAQAAYAAHLRAGRLDQAQKLVEGQRKKTSFLGSDAQNQKARLAMARADAAQAEGRLADAAKLAREALDLTPEDSRAALALAHIHAADGNPKKAAEVIAAQWRVAPSPALLRVYLDLWRTEDPAEVAKRVRDLTAANPEHPESRLALAEAYLRAQAFAEARAALAPLLSPNATATINGHAALAMARILAAEGADPAQQREWIERAAASLAA